MRVDNLGELTTDESVPEWLVSREVEVPYFPGAKLKFILEDVEGDDRPDEFAAAVARFFALATRDRDHAAPYVFTFYRQICEALGDDEIEARITSPADVWKHVHPTEIHVSRRHRADKKVYVQITAECDWEPEHGLQIVYREGCELKRVSMQDGHLTHADACAVPESQDRIV